MKLSNSHSTVFLTIILLAGCGAKDLSAQNQSLQIDSLYQQFKQAYNKTDLDLVVSLYEDSAYYLPGSHQQQILNGSRAVRDQFQSFFSWNSSNNRDLDISFRILKREISDSLAYDVGYYKVQSKPDSLTYFPEGSGSVGKFVTVIGLQEDGSWKFKLDGFSQAPLEAFPDSSFHDPVPPIN